MIVCAFHTRGYPYEDLVKPFKENILKHNDLKIDVQCVESKGSWELNCGIKPTIILQALNKYKEDILYLDIDAEVKGKLILPEFKQSMAVRIQDTEMLSGTLYFKYNQESLDILNAWIKEQAVRPYKWDQRVLQYIVQRDNINIFLLDSKYCTIKDSRKGDNNCLILHKQASRNFKKQMEVNMDIPNSIGKMRIIKNIDGSVSIARGNREAETWLDQNMSRVINQLKWTPKIKSQESINKLMLQGDSAYIIGKGPSLSNVTKKHFKNKKAPVFCINESIKVIEKLDLPNDVYVVIQDLEIKDDCRPTKGAGVICAHALNNFYADIENKFVFNPVDYHSHWNYTPIIAINIAKKFGITNFIMIAFDSIVNGDKTYAKEIGYQHARVNHPERYTRNSIGIKNALEGVKAEFLCPSREEKVDKSLREEDIAVQGNSDELGLGQ